MDFLDACRTLREAHAELGDFAMRAIERARESRLLRLDTSYHRALIVLFGKATKTFRAVRVLCAEGFGEDALILCRRLLDLWIDLAYIAADRHRAILWEQFSAILECELAERQMLMPEGRGFASEHAPQELEQLRAARDQAVKRFYPWYRQQPWRGWSGRTTREKAEEAGVPSMSALPPGRAGLVAEYDLVCSVLSGVEHSDVFSTASVLRKHKEGNVVLRAGPSPAHIIGSMKTALSLYFNVVFTVLHALDSPEAAEGPALDARIMGLVQQAPPERD